MKIDLIDSVKKWRKITSPPRKELGNHEALAK